MQKKIRDVVARVPRPRNLSGRLPGLKRRPREPESRLNQAIQTIPRITNETVAEHREEMLHGARRFIYPLAHSRRSIVVVSSSLLVVLVAAFFVYCVVSLYKLQSTSGFMYRITQVIPFPIARADGQFVAYENYLFELRHYIHYYQTQQNVDFDNKSGKDQLATFRQQALQQVLDATYVKRLAAQHNISVSDQEVDAAVNLLREQNRLGSSNQEFSDVLREFWGWSPDDFRRELKGQLLAQKVAATLDTATDSRAQQALAQLNSGVKFADVAKQYSDDDATKNNGGVYPFAVDRSSRDLAPQLVDELFKLQPGQTSGLVNTGYALEIVQVQSVDGGKVHAAHISFNFQPIAAYLKPLQDKSPPHLYVTLHQ